MDVQVEVFGLVVFEFDDVSDFVVFVILLAVGFVLLDDLLDQRLDNRAHLRVNRVVFRGNAQVHLLSAF